MKKIVALVLCLAVMCSCVSASATDVYKVNAKHTNMHIKAEVSSTVILYLAKGTLVDDKTDAAHEESNWLYVRGKGTVSGGGSETKTGWVMTLYLDKVQ